MRHINDSGTMTVQQLLDEGLHCYRNRELENALFYFEQLLEIANNNTELLHTVIKLLQEMQRFNEAIDYGEKLLNLSPDNEEFLLTQAENYFHINSYNNALPLYLQLHGKHPSDLHLIDRLVFIYKEKYNLSDVEMNLFSFGQSKSQSIIINKSISVSSALIDKDKLGEASILLESVLLIESYNVEANGLYGTLLKEKKEYKEALYYLDKAVIKSSFKYLAAFAQCLEHSVGISSVVSYLEGLAKEYPENYLNKKLLGLYYYKSSDYVKAESIFSTLLCFYGEEDVSLIKYKVLSCCKRMEDGEGFIGRDELISISKEIFSLRKMLPHDLEVATSLMKIYISMGELKKAYDICVNLAKENPSNNTVLWNMHTYFLALRDRKSFFNSYFSGRSVRCKSSWESVGNNVWNGEDIKGKRVVILREQGIGDEILFASNYGWIIEQSSCVDIFCSSRLHNAFSRIFPTAHFHPFVEGKVLNINAPNFQECISSADAVILSGDLPAFYYRDTGAPLYKENYFTISDEKKIYWERKLNSKVEAEKVKVGLIWRSGFVSGSRSSSYLTNDEVSVIISAIPEVEFINCMYVECNVDINEIEGLTKRKIHQLDDLDQKNDFENTAAMLSNLDLLIGAYTATLSLSAAVGTPVVAYGSDYLKEDRKLKKDALYYKNVSHVSLPVNDNLRRKEAINIIIDEVRKKLKLD